MTGYGGIMHAFGGLGETGYAAVGAQRVKLLKSAGQHFVGVALVTNVKNEAVTIGVVYAMYSGGKLDSTEIGSKVTARFGNTFGDLLAQLIAEFYKLRL